LTSSDEEQNSSIMSKEKEALKGTNEERVAFNIDDSAKEADAANHDDYADGDTSKVRNEKSFEPLRSLKLVLVC
jgi:hypothetical protein